MKFSAVNLRSVEMALTLALLGSALARGQDWAVGAVHVVAQNTAPSSKITLAPEVESKLKELIEKAKVKKGEAWNAEMKKEIDDLAQTAALSDAGQQTLAAAAKQAVAASLQTWSPDLPDAVRRHLSRIPPQQAVALIEQAQEQFGAAMSWSDSGPSSVLPDQQDVWTKALRQTLTPAQLEAWTQERNKRKDEAEKQIAAVLKSGADRNRDQQMSLMTSECKSIETTLKLPADRASQLEALGKSVVDQVVEKLRAQQEKMLLAMNEDQRKQMLNAGFYMPPGPNDSATQIPAWKDGLTRLLTAGEQAQLQAAGDGRKVRREHVMGQVLVMLLDEKIALTSTQRQKLEPIADRLVADIPALYPQGNPGDYYNVSPDVFYTATAKTTDAELKPILDDVQLKRWHDLAKPDTAPDNDPPPVKTPEVHSDEPEYVDKAISDFFYEKTESERRRELEANSLKAEDVARVAGLNAESSERLEAAAAGATEQSLMTWKWFTEQQIRAQLQGITPQNVNQRLESLQDFFFQRRFGISNGSDIWDETVQSELTPDQQAAWKKETDAREDYRGGAIAAAVLSEFDRQAHLTDDQWDKLRPLIAGVLHDYSRGFAQVFSGMNGMEWYLGGPYILIPLAGVDDQQLKSILTKDQMDLWTSSPQFANANNLWQVVHQMRGQPGIQIRHVRRAARPVIQD
jgi:hypothetical protein